MLSNVHICNKCTTCWYFNLLEVFKWKSMWKDTFIHHVQYVYESNILKGEKRIFLFLAMYDFLFSQVGQENPMILVAWDFSNWQGIVTSTVPFLVCNKKCQFCYHIVKWETKSNITEKVQDFKISKPSGKISIFTWRGL